MFALLLATLVPWLTDFYLLSTVLLLIGLPITYALKQPARRMAATRSLAAGLAALAMLATAPGWPRPAAIEWSASDTAPALDAQTPTAAIETSPGTSVEKNRTSFAIGRPAELPNAPPARHDVRLPTAAPAGPGLPSWRSIVAVIFMIGAAINLAWLALGAIQAVRLRRLARAAPPRLQIVMARVFQEIQHTPCVCLSTRIGLPVAVGMIRPMIVLPDSFAEREPDIRLEAALVHEWVHIRNGDLRWLALLRLLNVVFFAQPLFWCLRRMIRADQEALADASAGALHGDGRLAYAETLLGWARSSHRQQPGALASAALALWERPSMLHRRVRLLLDPEYRVEQAASRCWRLGAACLGLVASLLISMVTLRPSAATAQNMKARQGAKNPAEAAIGKAKVAGDRFEYAGRVLDPDGKPFAAAKLYLAYFGDRGDSQARIRATSDAEGRFRFTVAKGDFDVDHAEPWYTAQVVASADGFGPGWANTFRESMDKEREVKPDPRNLTIALARDDVPISGRIVDLQGRPVAGVLIHTGRILEPERGDLSAWLAASKSSQDGSYETERAYLHRALWSGGYRTAAAIVTDAQGRFLITGVGRERVIEIKISGPTVQFKEIKILTRDVEPFRVTHGRRSPDWGIALYYGARFTHPAAPTKPVVGVIKDKDTGKPLAGVRIASDRTAEFPVYGFNGIEAITGQDGAYRLLGLPKGNGNHVIATPSKGQPYLASGLTIPDTPGLDPVVLDIGLKRGIVIEGRVTDKDTGEPVSAFVEYNAIRDNPHLSEAPGFDQARIWGHYKTESDGTYRIVAIPGRGVISALFLGESDLYLTGVGLNGDVNNLSTVPNGMLDHFNVLSQIDLPREPPAVVRRDLALQRGLERRIRVVDPDGRPVAHARLQGHIRYANWNSPQESPEFQVQGLRRGEKRRLHALLEDRKLAGWVDVLAEDKGTAELKLQPWAAITGRLVDDDGTPRDHVDLVPDLHYERHYATDSSGHFRIEGLIAGLPQGIWVSPKTGFLSGKFVKGLVLRLVRPKISAM